MCGITRWYCVKSFTAIHQCKVGALECRHTVAGSFELCFALCVLRAIRDWVLRDSIVYQVLRGVYAVSTLYIMYENEDYVFLCVHCTDRVSLDCAIPNTIA